MPVRDVFIQDAGMDLSDLYRGLRHRWLLLMVALVVGGAVGYAASFLLQVKYRAQALIAVSSEDQQGGSLRALAGSLGSLAGLAGIQIGGADQSRASTVAILSSHTLAEKFIEQNGLLPELFPGRWDTAAGSWKQFRRPPPDLRDGVEYFLQKMLVVLEDRRTGLITVKVVGPKRERIADWANGLVALANASARTQAITRADDALAHLRTEAGKVNSLTVEQSLFSLIEMQLNRRMLANTRPDYAFQVIDPARMPRIGDKVSPSRVGIASVGAMLMLMLAAAWALVRARAETTG